MEQKVEQTEKIEKLKALLDKRGVKYYPKSSEYKGTNSWSLFIAHYNIPVFDDAVINAEKAYYTTTAQKHKPFFIRTTESIDFILEKMNNMLDDYDRIRRNRIKKARNRAIYNFILTGLWQKIDKLYKSKHYHSNVDEFYDEFIKRKNTQFDGDSEKAAASFVDEFKAKFRPKPKRKRLHFVPVKPIRHN